MKICTFILVERIEEVLPAAFNQDATAPIRGEPARCVGRILKTARIQGLNLDPAACPCVLAGL